jgi:D-serine dehydratase
MTSGTALPPPLQPVMLDDSLRGVPAGLTGFSSADLAGAGWHPADGRMSLPVLTLDEEAFAANTALFLRYAAGQGVLVAPHAKTPMAPDLARYLVDQSAWGASVADIRQAGVLLRSGLRRLILANQTGGPAAARRLAALLRAHADAELLVFADSLAAVEALGTAWAEAGLAPLPVLVEVGAGRAGARSLATARSIAEAVARAPALRLAGVAAYEGSAVKPTPAETETAIAGLMALIAEVFAFVRQLRPEADLTLTAGGSVWFDRVVAALGPLARADGKARLILRSGAIFFHDHGAYDRGLAALDARGGFVVDGVAIPARKAFRPALKVWAEVLSCPEPGLAICGMGKRDVSHDLDLPVVLARHRAGATQALDGVTVTALNDQHAFLALPEGADLVPGDVISFGISHPCTCLDRYRLCFGTDAAGTLRHAYPTEFG